MSRVSAGPLLQKQVVIVVQKYISYEADIRAHTIVNPSCHSMRFTITAVGLVKIGEPISFDVGISAVQVETIIRTAQKAIVKELRHGSRKLSARKIDHIGVTGGLTENTIFYNPVSCFRNTIARYGFSVGHIRKFGIFQM